MALQCNTCATQLQRKRREKDRFRERFRSRRKEKNAPVKIKKYLDILRAYDNNNNYNKNDNIITIKITTIKNVNSMLEINAFVAMKKWYIEV